MPEPPILCAQSAWDDQDLAREVAKIAAKVLLIDQLTADIPRLKGQLRTAERKLQEARWDLNILLRRQATRVVQGYLPLPQTVSLLAPPVEPSAPADTPPAGDDDAPARRRRRRKAPPSEDRTDA